MSRSRSILLVLGCVLLISGSGFWTYHTQFAAPPFQVDLHRAVGAVMAEETARLLNHSGKIVVISIELAGQPELRTQLEEFERTLRRFPGLRIARKLLLETDDKAKYSFGSGLSGRRYVRLVHKNPGTDAFVSFVGAPRLSEAELAELKPPPRLIAESRVADRARQPFEQKILDVAVVSRFQFPTPVKGRPGCLQEWFEQRWQVVTRTNAAALPSGKDE